MPVKRRAHVWGTREEKHKHCAVCQDWPPGLSWLCLGCQQWNVNMGHWVILLRPRYIHNVYPCFQSGKEHMELAGLFVRPWNCNKSCSFYLRRINRGCGSLDFFPPQLPSAYAQNHHPWHSNCNHQWGFFQSSCAVTAFPPTWRTGRLKWVTHNKGPRVAILFCLTHWKKNLVRDAGFILWLKSVSW